MPEHNEACCHLKNARLEEGTVLSNTLFAKGCLGVVEIAAPLCASLVQPGQFVHVELPHDKSHMLRRPISVYQINENKQTITLLYQVVGKGTQLLSTVAPLDEISIFGPLGTGWQPSEVSRCLLVGGGVGAAPLYLLAQTLVAQGAAVDVVLGAATKDFLITAQEFAGVVSAEALHVCTDDGSQGHKGFVTEVCKTLLASTPYDYLATCGPEPMQKALCALVSDFEVLQCQVSLERRMACGIGACLGCVVDTTAGKKRACYDGPVFDAKEIVWQA